MAAATTTSKPLRVEKPLRQSKYHHSVRVDRETLDSLNLEESEIVQVIGRRTTVARCYLLYSNDTLQGVLRANEVYRDNAGVAVGDTVVLKRIENSVVAKRIVLSPVVSSAQSGLPINRAITGEFSSFPVVVGDALAVPHALEDAMSYERSIFRVMSIQPELSENDAGIIKKETEFVIAPNPIQVFRLKEKSLATKTREEDGMVGFEINAKGVIDEVSCNLQTQDNNNSNQKGNSLSRTDDSSKILSLHLTLFVRTKPLTSRTFTIMLSRNQDFDTVTRTYIAKVKEIVSEVNAGVPVLDISYSTSVAELSRIQDRLVATQNYIWKVWSDVDE